jgi:KaiC/GvpD/RAD55 family RecA-like ATPase
MIDGGLIRDSICIVRGPTGSGKTMLAGLYARAGAQRGERVVYYSFEELKRTLRVIKMRGSRHETHPFRLQIGDGGLTVQKLPPPARRNSRANDAPAGTSAAP